MRERKKTAADSSYYSKARVGRLRAADLEKSSSMRAYIPEEQIQRDSRSNFLFFFFPPLSPAAFRLLPSWVFLRRDYFSFLRRRLRRRSLRNLIVLRRNWLWSGAPSPPHPFFSPRCLHTLSQKFSSFLFMTVNICLKQDFFFFSRSTEVCHPRDEWIVSK